MSTDTLLDLPLPGVDDRAIVSQADATLQDARALTVTDGHTYALAGERVTGLRALSKSIEAFFKDPIDLANKAHKALTAKRKGLIDPIEAEVTRLGRDMANYASEQERIAREAQAQAERESREQMQAAALEQAADLEAQGLVSEAAAAMDAMLEPAPVVVSAALFALPVPKVEGVSYRETWTHRVVNPALVPREYLLVNDSAIAKVVAATKGAVHIPGVEVVVEKTPVVRGR